MIHNIFIAIISESYESLKIRPIKTGYEEEDSKRNSLAQEAVAPIVLENLQKSDKRKKYKGKKKDKYFRKLLEIKIKEENKKDPKTMEEVKKANKLMKKIRKNIKKIGKFLDEKKYLNANKEDLKRRAEDLLLTDLDEYIENALKSSGNP